MSFGSQMELVGIDVGLVLGSMALVHVTTRDLELTQLLWWYPFVFILVYYAGIASSKLGFSVDDRWLGTCPESYIFLRLYVAAQCAMIPIEALVEQPLAKKAMMITHHLVSVLAFVYGIYTRTNHWFGAMSGLSEVSTIFLEGLLVARRFNLPFFMTLNGAGLWLSFVIFRVILFPTVILVFVLDAVFYTDRSWDKAEGPFKFFVVPCILVMFALSLSWFTKIHKGFMDKVLKKD